MQTEVKPRMFKVLIPVEKKGGGTFWMRVGTGFASKDGSGALNLYIDATPTGANKLLHVREFDEEDFQHGENKRIDRRTTPHQLAASTGADEQLPF